VHKKLLETVLAGLERKALDSCSRWAEKCRVMGGGSYPGPWTFKHYPWLKDMHDSDFSTVIGQKAAQLGYTEAALNRTLYKIDIRQQSAAYILPTKSPDASEFSASRFDPALELSPYLQRLFSDVKNVGHKRAGSNSLYIRGSRSRAGLKSIPAGFLVFDELDEMNQENIVLALERQSGQLEQQTYMISTPTIDGFGINDYFIRSNQKEFFFGCPSCSRQTRLIFPECLEIIGDDPRHPDLKNSFLKCKECSNKLEHETKHIWLADGTWIPGSDGEYDGYHINQLYSPTVAPWQIAESYLLSLINAAYEQEFFNSKLGLPHIVKGARINDDDINQCIGNYKNGTNAKEGTIVTMGIDVGHWLHYVIAEYTVGPMATPDINMNTHKRILEINKVLTFEELDSVIYRHRPKAVVIDANPERRKAFELAQRFWGHVWVCFYGNAVNGKQITKTRDDNGQELEYHVTVDRTSWLDLSLSRHTNKSILLPLDLPTEYRSNIKALIRKPKIDKHGNPTSTYVNNADDHYGHSLNYSEIALPLAVGIGQSQNIRSPR